LGLAPLGVILSLDQSAVTGWSPHAAVVSEFVFFLAQFPVSLLPLVMKRIVLLVVACVAIEPSSAFVPSATLPTSLRSVRAASSATLTAVSPAHWDGGAARRRFLQLGACGVLGLANVAPAAAKRARSAPAQLLDEDGNPETQEERKARIKVRRTSPFSELPLPLF